MIELTNIGVTLDDLNSPERARRIAARKKLANAYPTRRVVVAFTNKEKLKTPAYFMGKVVYYPMSNSLTARGFHSSGQAENWQFLGFHKRGASTSPARSRNIPIVPAKPVSKPAEEALEQAKAKAEAELKSKSVRDFVTNESEEREKKEVSKPAEETLEQAKAVSVSQRKKQERDEAKKMGVSHTAYLLMKQEGITDTAGMVGTGANGAITLPDVKRFIQIGKDEAVSELDETVKDAGKLDPPKSV